MTIHDRSEHIEFSMTFDAPVTVTGDPTFAFDLGGATTATYYAGSGTTTLRFSHAVSGGTRSWIGVALMSVVTLRPSGTESTTSSARTVSARSSARASEPVERDLAPVGAPAGDDPEQLLGGLAGAAQVLHDACGLAVERDQGAGPRLEHHDADR